MNRDIKADARAINAILWQDWDPIGGGGPKDEYDNHVWPIYKLLIGGARREDVVAYLRRAADETIASPTPEERLQCVVDKLMALGVKRVGESEA